MRWIGRHVYEHVVVRKLQKLISNACLFHDLNLPLFLRVIILKGVLNYSVAAMWGEVALRSATSTQCTLRSIIQLVTGSLGISGGHRESGVCPLTLTTT